MANCKFFSLMGFFFFIIFIIQLSEVTFSEAQKLAPAIYVFGDSLVDVGNNNYLKISLSKANFPHNGIDFPTKKPTGRFSNGKNAADFLAEKVGLPTSPPYLSFKSKLHKNDASFADGVSFASGGAGIFNGTDDTFRQSLPLAKQVEYYSTVFEELVKQLGSTEAQKRLSKSLFVIVIGSNDIFGYFENTDLRKKYTLQQYADFMVVTLKQRLQQLHGYGARKFVVAGVGPIGCCPGERYKSKTEECKEDTNELSVKYNEALKSMLEELKIELKDINYSYFDTYSLLLNITKNPASYGFVEVKAACCGLGNLNAEAFCLPVSKYCSNRRDHVFWDKYHPTEAASSILVDNIFDGPSQYSFPLNVKQLIAP
ncbi:hypothetical protein FEM48_Zijuj01G0233600 [Ziziphus jujuba var. spinosa]|uniref:GDSL esterase/lipase At5g55050-like n=1 Tax=Ziziphus jujuba var. spinosa TaxID=714518 RepID=A0A978W457_ZIZJJ|nr:hypothetical protein FEM48_Zijuj01G0233600 [Ziziphus jujuba var. spinosa]